MTKSAVTISTIIPVYNTRDYVGECIESILSQSIQEKEILVIDDGSEDGSWEIIQDYTARYDCIQSFRQNRKRQGAARNLGLQHARGEFITFVDSDDTVPVDAYRDMYRLATENASEMVIGIIESFNGKRTWRAFPVHEHMFDTLRINTSIHQMPELLTDISVCNRLIRRDLIDALQTKFLESTSGEDLDFSARLYLRSRNITVYPEIAYNYRATPNARSTKVYSLFFENRVKVTLALKKQYESNGAADVFPYLLRSELRKLTGNRIRRAVQQNSQQELEHIFTAINRLACLVPEEEVLSSSDFSSAQRIRILLIQNRCHEALIDYEKRPSARQFLDLIENPELAGKLLQWVPQAEKAAGARAGMVGRMRNMGKRIVRHLTPRQ